MQVVPHDPGVAELRAAVDAMLSEAEAEGQQLLGLVERPLLDIFDCSPTCLRFGAHLFAGCPWHLLTPCARQARARRRATTECSSVWLAGLSIGIHAPVWHRVARSTRRPPTCAVSVGVGQLDTEEYAAILSVQPGEGAPVPPPAAARAAGAETHRPRPTTA
jgi:hypothetical protein